MHLKSLKHFPLPVQLKIVTGILMRKLIGPGTSTGQLLNNKLLIDRILKKGGNVVSTKTGFDVSIKTDYSENPIKFQIRKSSTDGIIFSEIILHNGGDYKLVQGLAGRLKININTIIDAGANVGTATVFFKSIYRNAKVVCIEPEPGNFEMLSMNIRHNGYENVTLCQNALWINNDVLKIGTGVRGTREKELSFAVVDDADSSISVKGITFKDCLKMLNTDVVDLFKIDIEGAEAQLMDDKEGFSYILNHTRILAIELHAESVDCFKFLSLIEAHGMSHIQQGEIVYCWKNSHDSNN